MDADLVLFDDTQPTVEEIPNIPGTWVINNLITKAEADNFIKKIAFDEIIDTSTRINDNYQASIIRKSLRYKHDILELSAQIYSRLQGIAPKELVFEQEDDELGPFLVGAWSFDSVNERISFLKYEPGGVFSRHRDGIFIKHQDLRSLVSVVVYLNDDYFGGRTKAFSDDEVYEFAIEPVIGSAFMMVQRVLHEGGEVVQGVKYAIRFDLLYSRVQNIDPVIQDKNELAAKYLAIAGELERSHQGAEAVKYYRMAFKLNPKLEEML